MYLKQIRLKNFQGHEDSKFDLSNNFTCIIGENNQGKSSIVRALMFLFFDLWDESFIREGSELVEVSVTRDDDITLIRRKGKTINEVEVRKDNKVIETYNNFGKILPDEIKDKFQIRAVKLDLSKEENINIAGQFDQPFLLFETGPTKLKILNRITGAYVVDIAQRELNKDKKRLMSKERELEELVIDEDNKLKQYVDLVTLEEQLKQAETVFKELETAIKHEDKLLGLKLKLNAWREKKEEWVRVNTLVESINIENFNLIKNEHNNLINLQGMIDKYEKVNKSISENEESIKNLKKVYESTLMKAGKLLLEAKICPTCFKPLEKEEVNKIVDKRYTI